MTVHKFYLTPGVQTVVTHAGVKWLHASTQGTGMVLWGEVDTSQPKVKSQVAVIATGQELPEGPRQFLGTCQVLRSVFHVFHLPEAESPAEDRTRDAKHRFMLELMGVLPPATDHTGTLTD